MPHTAGNSVPDLNIYYLINTDTNMTNIGAQKLRGIGHSPVWWENGRDLTVFMMANAKPSKPPRRCGVKNEGLSVLGGGGGYNQLFSFVLHLSTDNFLSFLRALVVQLPIS